MINSPNAVGHTVATAAQWIALALTGSAATAIAIIAVASIGMMAFAGRINLRRVMQVILGCFVLFGAPLIAAGLQGLAMSIGGYVEPPTADPMLSPLEGRELSQNAPEKRDAYDPYAGAAPMWREPSIPPPMSREYRLANIPAGNGSEESNSSDQIQLDRLLLERVRASVQSEYPDAKEVVGLIVRISPTGMILEARTATHKASPVARQLMKSLIGKRLFWVSQPLPNDRSLRLPTMQFG